MAHGGSAARRGGRGPGEVRGRTAGAGSRRTGDAAGPAGTGGWRVPEAAELRRERGGTGARRVPWPW